MAIIAGIDEAGYGPTLGPLVVTGVAFEVPDDQVDGCLWKLLSAVVTRRISKRGRRLPIVDSKKLYQRQAGLGKLEATALTMLRTFQAPPATFRELLGQVALGARDSFGGYAWYRDLDFEVPVAATGLSVAMQANAVRRHMDQCGVRLIGVFCEPLPEGHFNRLVNSVRNKATLLLGLTMGIVQRLVATAQGRPVRVYVDRQSGRSHYTQKLLTAFEPRDLRVIDETDSVSAYEVRRGGGDFRIEFRVEGEEHHMAIALASVFSKYVRELFMHAFNRYWCGQAADLKPTAGYYNDAQRFLEHIGPIIEQLQVDRQMLVRQR